MVFHKKYQNEWERFLHLSLQLKKIEEKLILKETFVFLVAAGFIFSLMVVYSFYIKEAPLTQAEGVNTIASIFVLGALWAFSMNHKLENVAKNAPFFEEFKTLKVKLSDNQALLEGYELIEQNVEGKRCIEDFLLTFAKNN